MKRILFIAMLLISGCVFASSSECHTFNSVSDDQIQGLIGKEIVITLKEDSIFFNDFNLKKVQVFGTLYNPYTVKLSFIEIYDKKNNKRLDLDIEDVECFIIVGNVSGCVFAEEPEFSVDIDQLIYGSGYKAGYDAGVISSRKVAEDYTYINGELLEDSSLKEITVLIGEEDDVIRCEYITSEDKKSIVVGQDFKKIEIQDVENWTYEYNPETKNLLIINNAEISVDLNAIFAIESSSGRDTRDGEAGEIGPYQIKKICFDDYNDNARGLPKFTWEDMRIAWKASIVADWYVSVRLPYLLERYGLELTEKNIVLAYNAGAYGLSRGRSDIKHWYKYLKAKEVIDE